MSGHFLPDGVATAHPQEMTPSSELASVLLVDDSAFSQHAGAGAETAGYKVPGRHQRAGRACDLCARPDLRRVLTDMRMPRHERFEFGREHPRRTQHLSQMPIIGLSSLVSPAAIERGGRPASTTTLPNSIVPA